jgi:hypothetical protein
MEKETTKNEAPQRISEAELTSGFISTEFSDRLLASAMANLAVELALRSGEEVQRPLSREHLARALDVNWAELQTIFAVCEEHWTRRHRDGQIPADALRSSYEESSK